LTGIIGRETPPLFLIADIRLLRTLAVALAEGFEEDYAGGYAYVEGFYRAGGGQGDQEIAALAGPSFLSPERKRHAMPCPERALLAGYKHGDGGVRASFLDLPQH
jgi:hypothetical protein